MKSVNVTELKSHLSRYLRLASRGARIAVKDRDDVIAEIGPAPGESRDWPDRLARDGRLRPGTQRWADLRASRLRKPIDIQRALDDVRGDPSEIRRR